MKTKKYWVTKALEHVEVKSIKYNKEDIINVLSRKSYNLAKDLNINYATAASLSKKLCPTRTNNGKLDVWLLRSIGKKFCNKCEQVLDFSEFHKNKSNKDGLSSSCKDCRCVEQKKYYDENPEAQISRVRKRERNLDRALTQQEIEFIFTRDKQKCQRCGCENEQHNIDYGQNLQLDHIVPVTKEGKTEISNIQLLCRSCNASKGNR